MRIAGFMLRVYRFPIPEILIVGLTVLTIVSSSTTLIYIGTVNTYQLVVDLVGIPKFAAVIVLAVFLWEFISMVRGPLINTILSLPLSRLDLYITYLVGAIALPLTIVALPVIVAYVTMLPSLGKDLAIAMLCVLSNIAMIFSIASVAGLLAKSRGLGVGLAIALWLALPIASTVIMVVLSGALVGHGAGLSMSQLYAIACLDPSSVVHYAIARHMDVGSILLRSGFTDLIIALILIIATGYVVVKRWEPV